MVNTRLIHLWNHCNACGAGPIVGDRFECQTCPLGPDSDFCAACYSRVQAGALPHPSPDNAMNADLSDRPHHFKSFPGQPETEAQSWLRIPFVETDPPNVADGFVLRPEFCAGYESTFAGYSFAVEHPGGQGHVLLTAFHVMDEMLRKKGVDATGENPAYTGRELPQHITGVNLYNIYAANWMTACLGKAGHMMVLPRARTKTPEPISDLDLAAFRLDQTSGLVPGKLAAQTPEVGEPIWLAASHGRGDGRRTFPAVVVAVTPRSFIYRFKEEVPRYTSGAPLLNKSGEVVAVNVGGGTLDGNRLGHGNQVTAIRAHLD